MKNLHYSRNKPNNLLLHVAISIFVWGCFLSAPLAQAVEPAVYIQTDKTFYKPGETVKLTWQIEGIEESKLQDCDISGTDGFDFNNISTFTGTTQYNLSYEQVDPVYYTLTCPGVISVPPPGTPPTLEVAMVGGTDKTQADIDSGILKITWKSNNADYCGYMNYRKTYSSSYTRLSGKVGVTEEIKGIVVDRKQGTTTINNAQNKTLIIGPTYFGTTCYNADGKVFRKVEMTVDGESMKVDPVKVTLESYPYPEILKDGGQGKVTLRWYTNGVRDLGTCNYTATNSAGESITVTGWTNLRNTKYASGVGGNDVYITQDTTFTLTCQRTTPNASSDSKSITLKLVDALSEEITDEAGIKLYNCFNTGNVPEQPEGPINGPSGWRSHPTSATSECILNVDLTSDGPAKISQSTEDGVKGTHSGVRFESRIKNLGPAGLPSNVRLGYKTYIGIGGGSTADLILNTEYVGHPVDGNPTYGGYKLSMFDNVLFGTSTACFEVNLEPNTEDGIFVYDEINALEEIDDKVNNEVCEKFFLDVPEPPMTITTDHIVIRKGRTTNVEWNVTVEYLTMRCRVKGIGGVDVPEFDPSSSPGGSVFTGPLESSGEFVLTCTEQTTGQSHTKTTRVDVVAESAEI
jgi:hypothetical protein